MTAIFWLDARGLKTLTSKCILRELDQNPLHFTSSQQLSSTLADLRFIIFPIIDWSVGSTSTLGATSQSIVAVTSRISLCLMMTYPPLAQLKAWLTPFGFPQMQTLGIPCGRHPYLRAIYCCTRNLYVNRPTSVPKVRKCQTLMLSSPVRPLSHARSFAHIYTYVKSTTPVRVSVDCPYP